MEWLKLSCSIIADPNNLPSDLDIVKALGTLGFTVIDNLSIQRFDK